MSWCKHAKLVKHYRESLKIVRTCQIKANEEDRKVLGSMASDLQYSIEWLQTGKRPGNRRGADRRAAYQREILIDDPIKVQKYMIASKGHNGTLTQAEKERLEDALSVLTPLEREVYLMSRGECISYSEIGKMLGIEKTTVASKIERAEAKIAERKYSSLLCI